MDLRGYKRLAVLTGERLGSFSSKTAAGVIRYRPDDVVAVIDWAHAGQDLATLLGWGRGIPIVPGWAEAAAHQPDALLIGVAPMGGQLDAGLRRVVCDAVKQGVSIISGLHTLLREDLQLAKLAAASGAQLLDVRDPGKFEIVATAKARHVPARRVLTIGTDCVVGKMMTALELTFAARKAGLRAEFVPTGQTGIMIAGWGISVDRVISDFAAGAAEWLVQQVAHSQICFVEGQGSIEHPGYSGVTLSLMHGCCPDAMIMCTRQDRTCHHGLPHSPVADINRQIELCERLAACVHPARVVGVSVNTAHMTQEQARQEIDEVTGKTGLPATDPVRFGAGALLPAILSAVRL